MNPLIILLFSGKRKSGKDYIAEYLYKKLGNDKCEILRLSAPLKSQYAKEHNLEYDRLLDASDYKETYRESMILWGEDIRNQNPGYFCKLAIEQAASKPVWLVSDSRRPSDLDYFRHHFPDKVKTVRIVASEKSRIKRGWKFTPNIDDAESECGLDGISNWDLFICNEEEKSFAEVVLPLEKLLEGCRNNTEA